jgi:hypothetical protein
MAASVSHAKSTSNQKADEATMRFTNNVTIDENTVIGIVEITTVSKSVPTNKGIETTVNIYKDYTLYPNYQDEYGKVYKNRNDQAVVLVTNNNDLYINGKKKDYKKIEKALTSDVSAAVADTGGLPSICHYYLTADRTSYTFQCYESMKLVW